MYNELNRFVISSSFKLSRCFIVVKKDCHKDKYILNDNAFAVMMALRGGLIRLLSRRSMISSELKPLTVASYSSIGSVTDSSELVVQRLDGSLKGE